LWAERESGERSLKPVNACESWKSWRSSPVHPHSRVGVAGSGISGFSQIGVALEHVNTERMDSDNRAELLWSRTAGLASHDRKVRAVDIIEAEIRSAQREALLEAAKLVVLTADQPVIEVARLLHGLANQVMQPKVCIRKKRR
jgi:hypothetical protein